MACPVCLGANPASAATCEHCGASLASLCAGCGSPLSSDARFCGSCGRPAVAALTRADAETVGPGAAGSLGAERRLVTVLFADIVGSTALAERLDPEDYRELLERTLGAFEAAVRRHDGTVAQLLGDGILAFFGAPIAHDDDPIRAAFVAREIVEAADRLAGALRARGIELAVRVGIDTGLVVVGPVGGDPRREYLATGDAVNVAARLQALAPPMGILMTRAAAALVESRFEVHEHGSLELRGRRGRLTAWSLGPALASTGRVTGPVGGRFVGRAAELAALRSAVQVLATGHGRIALVLGEPGLGKTRLVQECRRLVRGAGTSRAPTTGGLEPTWIEIAGVPHGERTGYQLVTALVRALLADGEPDHHPGRARLDIALPHAKPLRTGTLARLLGLPLTDQERDDVALLEPSRLPRAYTDALRDLLTARAEGGPIILVIEDLHWADPSSVDVLAKVLGVVDRHPVFVLLVSRPETTSAGWRLVEQARERAGSSPVELTLGPLDATATDELAARFLGSQSPYLRVVRERSDGNPLFAEELARSLAERARSGDLGPLDDAIPAALHGVLLARLDRLPPAARAVARVGSVIGRRFPLDVLGAAATRDAGPGLAALERAGLVDRIAEGPPEEYAFRHVLIQEAAYASILHAEARRLHGAVARTLARQGRKDPALAPTVARHFAAAGLHGAALGWFRAAIDRARASFANEEALALLDAALASATALGSSGSRDSGRAVGELRRSRGDVLMLIGRASEARSAYQAALAALPAADAIGRSRILRDIGPTFEAQQRYADAEAAYLAAEATLGEPGADDAAWWKASLDLRLRYCEFLYWAGRLGDLEAAITRLEEPVRIHGNGRQQGDFHSRVVMMREQRGRYGPDEIAIEHQRAALRAMEHLGSTSATVYMRFGLGFAELWGGHLEDAEHDMREASALAERIGDAATAAMSDAYMAVLHRIRHRRREALEAGERTIEACASLGPLFEPYRGVGDAMRGSLALETKDLAGAREHLERAVDRMDDYARLRGTGWPFEWIARLPLLDLEFRQGHVEAAIAQGRRLLDRCQQVLPAPIAEPLEHAVALASTGGDGPSMRRHLAAAVVAARAEGRI